MSENRFWHGFLLSILFKRGHGDNGNIPVSKTEDFSSTLDAPATMLTFAFTVLVLILAVVAGSVAFRDQIARERSIWRKKRGIMQSQIQRQAAVIGLLSERVTVLELQARKQTGYQQPPTANMRSKMEDRYVKDLSQVVEVGTPNY